MRSSAAWQNRRHVCLAGLRREAGHHDPVPRRWAAACRWGRSCWGEKAAASSLEPGDHGTTYGGNPFVCAAVSKVFDLFEEKKLVDHVKALTPYLEQKLDELVTSHDCLAARRGKGLRRRAWW